MIFVTKQQGPTAADVITDQAGADVVDMQRGPDGAWRMGDDQFWSRLRRWETLMAEQLMRDGTAVLAGSICRNRDLTETGAALLRMRETFAGIEVESVEVVAVTVGGEEIAPTVQS